jgi:hypothetical protein
MDALVPAGAALLGATIGAVATIAITQEQIHAARQQEQEQIQAAQRQDVDTFLRTQRQAAYTTLISDSYTLENDLQNRATEAQLQAVLLRLAHDQIIVGLIDSSATANQMKSFFDVAQNAITSQSSGNTAQAQKSFSKFSTLVKKTYNLMAKDIQS